MRLPLPQGSVLLLRIEFLRCQLMVKSIEKDNQADMYSKSAVEVTYNASQLQTHMSNCTD